MDITKRKAIIIGAGPAGLTAAYELLDKTDIRPIIFEITNEIGGIAKTVNYNGNRIDIGGHRFFSKSDRVMKWWQNILPLQGAPARDDVILKRKVPLAHESRIRPIGSSEVLLKRSPDPEKDDKVSLNRSRLSRIFFMRKFFDYPVALNGSTISNLGLIQILKIGFSYLKTSLKPINPEKSLEDFFINRFGRELYITFFKDYTEKVWGVPCNEIKADWGAQRVKGLSIKKTVIHAIKNALSLNETNDISEKKVETSLIGQFMYPKYGPGQIWEEVARIITNYGGEIYMSHQVVGLEVQDDQVKAVVVKERGTGEKLKVEADFFFSTMPVKDLINAIHKEIPRDVKNIADGLMYRDFITIGLLLDDLKIKNQTQMKTINNIVPDNWIYIQERDVKLGRLQIFNNWSPYLVSDPNKVWVGLEYFCNEGDKLWNMMDEEITSFAISELSKIDIIKEDAVIDSVVIRVPKTYPAYFGSYERFGEIKNFTDGFKNLFLIGRNGMHRYNNMDHSMLTAMLAVENIKNGVESKDNLWSINAEDEYHEGK
ncbi:MAG: NAD(P)/FAD-dependent oxidoreductase [Methanobacteriaceae archaeon]|nr:NAD(P)/FAD-dependent oxidoreductase [Methanobacteriaceae archaeon]